MRTLHVAATFGCGGIATSLWHLLPALKKLSGNTIEGAALYEIGWFGTLLKAEGVPVRNLHMTSKYDPRVLPRLVKLFKEFDIIHAHGWPVIFFVMVASFFGAKPRLVLTEHSVTNGRRRLYLKWLDRLIYSRFDEVVAVSQAVAKALQEWQPQLEDKITVIYNGINIAYWPTAEAKNEIRGRLNLGLRTPVIFASGNYRFAKGFDLLLQSMAALVDKYRHEGGEDESLPVLVITGEGELQDSMAELARRLGLTEHIRFLGFRTDMPEILRAADVFVLSSRWEGCPMVILESMALGVPIAATNVGGVPELVIDNQTGMLVPSGSVQALAEGLFELLNDTKRAACLAEQGQQRLIQSFAVERSAGAMLALYRQTAGYVT